VNVGKRVAVIGAGNTAMDAARTALRMGAEEAMIVCQKMRLGEPDKSGRARPVPIEGEEVTIPVDNVVLAIGTTPNPLLTRTTSGLLTTKEGCLVADEETGRTPKPLVFAGGDAVTGAATVILAAGAGKRAAHAIHEALDTRG